MIKEIKKVIFFISYYLVYLSQLLGILAFFKNFGTDKIPSFFMGFGIQF